MKATVVPAQVTTIEDRIMGNLGFSQLALFVVPVLVGAGLFIILPPVMHGSLYKYLVAICIGLICGILAIRIKGKIVLLWLVTILRYNLRPKYYLFKKSTAMYREDYRTPRSEAPEEAGSKEPIKRTTDTPRLAFQDAAYVLETINNPASKLRFELTKKGGLNVRLTEVED
jgi:hypothetical protein